MNLYHIKKSPGYNVHTPLFKSCWVWTSLLSLKLNNNIKQLILQVRHKFKASFKNIVQADCWSCLTFPHHIAKKLTTASLNGCWLPETSRSFHYWQPASIWRLVPWLVNAPPYKKLARQPSHWINSGMRVGKEARNAWRCGPMQNNAHCKCYHCEGCQHTSQSGAHGVLVHAHCAYQNTSAWSLLECKRSLLLTPLNCINCFQCYQLR